MGKRFKIFKCGGNDCTTFKDHWVLVDQGSESMHISFQDALDKMNYRINNPNTRIWLF